MQLQSQFQSTLPSGERQGQVERAINLIEFQSTLPSGERRVGVLL